MIWRLLFILYCLEAALFFIIVPWTTFWTESVVHAMPLWLHGILDGMFVRGLVSGIGIIHIFVVIREIFAMMSGPGEKRRYGVRQE